MSLANFILKNGVFAPNAIDSNDIEVDGVDVSLINGNGGGSISVICNDGSIGVSTNNGVVTLSNSSYSWCDFPAHGDVNLANNNLYNVGAIRMENNASTNAPLNLYQGSDSAGSVGIHICDGAGAGQGNIGVVYDSKFNIPPSISANPSFNSISVANSSNSSSVINLPFNSGSISSGNAFQIKANGSALNFNALSNGSVTSTPMAVSQNGNTYFYGDIIRSGNSGNSQVYDSIYNPPSGITGVSSLAYYNTPSQSQQIVPPSNATVGWSTSDSANTFGTTSLTPSLNSRWTNSASSAKAVNVSGYISWNYVDDTTMRAFFGARNGIWVSDRYGYNEIVASSSDSNAVIQSFNFTIVLAPNDYITMYVWHNETSSDIYINVGNNYPSSRLVITQLN
jgi:hypothetical protein